MLSCWIAPDIVYGAAWRLHEDRETALTRSRTIFGSWKLTEERNAGAKELAEIFLGKFKIPTEVLDLLRSMQDADQIAPSVWQEMLDYRFDGSLTYPSTPFVFDNGQKALFILEERDIYTDILTQPIQSLNSMVAWLSTNWLQIADAGMDPAQFFLRHSMPEPFSVWLEATVAGYCGFAGMADPKRISSPTRSNIVHGYRSVSLAGWDRADPNEVAVCRKAAIEQASETLKPISRT